MPIIRSDRLADFVQGVFERKSASAQVARAVADSLVAANLRGHDSHGVIRVIEYVDWIDNGWINPAGEMQIVRDRGPVLMVDGHKQFGQIIGRQATQLAIAKTKELGLCVATIRNSAHLGRMGEFMEQAAQANLVAFSWTNTHGGGVLAAPFGGRQPRLSANPLAAAAPVPGQEAMIMDIATCALAEGKVKVARARGEPVAPGCLVDGRGEETTDPNAYYAQPKGAILPVAGHKGYALSLFADILAGALGGGSCSHTNADRVANGWFAIFIEPEAFAGRAFYDEQVGSLRDWIKSCPTMKGFDEVLVPGEPEARTLQERSENGIPIEPDTWDKLTTISQKLGAPAFELAP